MHERLRGGASGACRCYVARDDKRQHSLPGFMHIENPLLTSANYSTLWIMTDSTQEARLLLSQWIEHKENLDFLDLRLELRPDGILHGERHGTGNIIELQESVLRLKKLDGEEVTISINGTFVVKFTIDRKRLIVRSPDSTVSIGFVPHSDQSEQEAT